MTAFFAAGTGTGTTGFGATVGVAAGVVGFAEAGAGVGVTGLALPAEAGAALRGAISGF